MRAVRCIVAIEQVSDTRILDIVMSRQRAGENIVVYAALVSVDMHTGGPGPHNPHVVNIDAIAHNLNDGMASPRVGSVPDLPEIILGLAQG